MDKERSSERGPHLVRRTHHGALPITPAGQAEVQIAEGSVPRAGEQSDPLVPATQGCLVDTAHIGMIHR